MWANQSVMYQIYPLGFCGAPYENDEVLTHRILKVEDWIPHIKELGADCVLFNPVFDSDTHGYNTRDFTKTDPRLGTNEDFAKVCKKLHDNGIRVVLDGVFNHVGRGFWAFQDVLKNREKSPYVDWFARIDFGGNDGYNDGLWYEGWEGNYDLVKLNLRNPKVVEHIFNAIRGWVDEFDIDGLRLDVAYCLDHDFLRQIHSFTKSLKPDFFLVGETLHGDYNVIMNDAMLDSVTNYECYKGLYSSFNSKNLFEINHSLLRQFGKEQWNLYTGKHLLSFVDNHDVSRVASILEDPAHIVLIYPLMFGMPGIPSVYYGSEWGAKGRKEDGDPALRACFEAPVENVLFQWISQIAEAKRQSPALCYGDFSSIVLTNEACIFERNYHGKDNGIYGQPETTDTDAASLITPEQAAAPERVWVAINASPDPIHASFDAGVDHAHDLITDEDVAFTDGGHGLDMPGYSAYFLKL